MKFVKIIGLSVLASLAFADVFYVPDSLGSVQEALDSCASGDSIIVTGTYQDSGGISILNKSVHIYSQSYLSNPDSYNPGSGAAFFQENNSTPLVSMINADSSVISGFLLDAVSSDLSGGGIVIENSPGIELSSIYFNNNSIEINNSHCLIRKSKLYNADNTSADLATLRNSSLSLERVLVNDNTALSLFSLTDASTLNMENAIVMDNSCDSAVITSNLSSAVISFSTWNNNLLTNPAISSVSSDIQVRHSIITDPLPLDTDQISVTYSAVTQDYPGPGIILSDPQIDSTAAYPVLRDVSPCFAASDQDTSAYTVPETDYYGNDRPNPSWSYADIGAIESERYKSANIGNIYWISLTGNDIWGNGTEALPYASLQQAYDDCSVNDTLILTPGRHTTNCVLEEKNVFITSEAVLYPGNTDLRNTTILAGDTLGGSILDILNVDSLVVADLTFREGTGRQLYSKYSYGGALYINNSGCTLSRLNFIDNEADFSGGAIFALNSDLVADSLFLDSCRSYLGGAISLSASTLYLTQSRISNSAASLGGAVYQNNLSKFYGYYTHILDNSAVPEDSLSKSSLAPLSVAETGGGFFSHNSTVYFNNGLITGNSAPRMGSAVYCRGGRIKLIQSTVTDNQSDSTNSGALYLDDANVGSLVLNSILWNNGNTDIYLASQSDLEIAYSSLSTSQSLADQDTVAEIVSGNVYIGDPLLNPDMSLSGTSPLLDFGTDNYTFQNYATLNYPDSVYTGSAPDAGYLGAYPEISFIETPATQVSHETSPADFYLNAIYPNPFNPDVTLDFTLAKPGNITVSLYNIRGQKIITLMNRHLDSGHYLPTYRLSHLPSAVYICVIARNNLPLTTQKITLLK